MTFGWRRADFGVMVAVMACLCGVVSAANQAAPAQAPDVSENVFKNIQVLKGIPADEFMDVMGMFSASLGYDCVSCHSADLYNDRGAFAVATPMIQKARQMIVMVNTINRTYFGGQPRMSCFTCHRGQNQPGNIPSLALQYGELVDDPNAMTIFPDTRTTADQVLNRYIDALGGAQRLAGLTSFVATGTYEGFNTNHGPVPVEITAAAPDRRVQVVRMPEGVGVKAFDGRSGWAAEPWRPMPLMTFTGNNLSGARLEAIMSFPEGIRKAFSRWQVSGTTIDDRPVRILQGANDGELPVNFYFDDTGLLVRMVRWNRTAAGTVPVQVDYAEYREVAGVKMPFRTIMTWTDGQNTFELKDVRPNVQVDAARFARPAPYKRQ
ncbi:MAG: photosynthetic reaction center cytochrome c subunit [Acidobacteria bacterium]|nr:photosynthetic reaction center cytochrome c subunit [Acidobacteriota bacterium]